MNLEKREQLVSWTNTHGTYLDTRHSHKFINYNGVEYIAQCLNYRGEIQPKDADFVYPEVKKRILRDQHSIDRTLAVLKPIMFGSWADSVSAEKQNESDPFWQNGYFSYADARIAYACVLHFQPKLILEVGSGNSTKFFRKAIIDAGAETKIISIDPFPRAEIRGLIDDVVTGSVSDTDLSLFDWLNPGDVLFWDGSHVCFNGSDVCTLFLDVLPRLKPGVIVHVHDVSLPFAGFRAFYDLPLELSTHSHSESFMLATMLLNCHKTRIILPVHYLWTEKVLDEGGTSFWFING